MESMKKDKSIESTERSIQQQAKGDDDIVEAIKARRAEEAAVQEASLDPFTQKLKAMNDEKPQSSRSSYPYRIRNYESVSKGVPRWLVTAAGALAVAGLAVVPGTIANAQYGSEQAVSFAEGAGYDNVQFEDSSIFFVGWQGCDENDSVVYNMTAENAVGKEVTLKVCKGLFKSATLRSPAQG